MVKIRAARHVHLRAQPTGQIRTATFEERQHLVVPVVALIEGVIHAVNADSPELVLASELAKTPQGWNGRPVLPNHPADAGGDRISANDPATLESQAFGRIFNTRLEGKRLLMEAWLDIPRAQKLGGEAARVLERVQGGDVVEISVGAFVMAEAASGVWKGQPYAAVWREIVPDHLAMLPEGVTGACSVEMGCGAPRAAQCFSAAGKEKGMKVAERIAALYAKYRQRQAEEVGGETDADLRQMLHDALFAEEPGFLGIEAVMPEESRVIYAVAPDGTLQFFARGFEKTDAGVTLAGDKQEVVRTEKWETVDAGDSASREAAAGGCGCQGKRAEATPAAKEESVDKKALVAKILAKKGTPFVEADAQALETFPVERLEALAAAPEPEEKPVEATAAVVEPAAITREQVLVLFPDLAALEAQHKQRAAARKAELITAIGATKQAVYKPEQLQAMDNEALENIHALLSVNKPAAPAVDRSLLAPRAAAQTDDDVVPPPPSLKDAVIAHRAAQQKH